MLHSMKPGVRVCWHVPSVCDSGGLHIPTARTPNWPENHRPPLSTPHYCTHFELCYSLVSQPHRAQETLLKLCLS